MTPSDRTAARESLRNGDGVTRAHYLTKALDALDERDGLLREILHHDSNEPMYYPSGLTSDLRKRILAMAGHPACSCQTPAFMDEHATSGRCIICEGVAPLPPSPSSTARTPPASQ